MKSFPQLSFRCGSLTEHRASSIMRRKAQVGGAAGELPSWNLSLRVLHVSGWVLRRFPNFLAVRVTACQRDAASGLAAGQK